MSIPRDEFGNALGPCYESRVTARLLTHSGKLTGPTDTRIGGTYVFTIADLPRDEQPNTEISVDGVVVGNINPRNRDAKSTCDVRPALLAAALAAFHVFGKDGNDMVWGFAAGIGIGAVITWLVERGKREDSFS